ncbi:FAD-dependent monooxygenase [Rhizobiaceae bacterium n13]|uniref:FAD-dependent monooxygenase n=1 Tax=Ferirhizobium litorale TaxID=2927786 RepID=A0AAE3QDW8_9HYPH|nr:FAD-dependent monooxygenase [Fererhizobium litorale]MDI7864709.1 FAD-dependent monooxygenase [Fererhizobium litorale]MDI7922200.1 FAD-dependent monooxygenase [Fererhizobium litorale]
MKTLIVGAGIAGLATARALELKGFEVDIVERHTASPTAGQGLFLPGNATRALAILGILEEVLKIAFPIDAQRILTSRGVVVNEVATQTVWGDCGPCLALPRAKLIDALRKSLRTTRISYGMSVKATRLRNGVREVQFNDDSIGDYDLVIGADGIRSVLREESLGGAVPRPLGMCCWRLAVENPNQVDAWTAMLGKKRTLLAIPMSSSELYIYADCPTAEFGDGSIRVLKEHFSSFGNPLGTIIANLDEKTVAHTATLEEIPPCRFIGDRIVLVGDAAHACSPSMAQGAGMALEDAIVLANCLARNGQTDRPLEEFYMRRIERVDWVRQQCHARDKLRSASDLVRNLVLRHFGTSLYSRSYRPLTKNL